MLELLGELQAEGVEAGGDWREAWGVGEVVEEDLEVDTLTPDPSPKGEGRSMKDSNVKSKA